MFTGFTSETSKLTGMCDRIARRLEGQLFALVITTSDTVPTNYPKPPRGAGRNPVPLKERSPRDARANARALFINKALGRDVVTIDPDDPSKIARLWREGLDRFYELEISGQNGIAALETIGKKCADLWADLARNRVNTRNMKPLSPAYAKRKARIWGAGSSMLVASGQMLKSIIGKIIRERA